VGLVGFDGSKREAATNPSGEAGSVRKNAAIKINAHMAYWGRAEIAGGRLQEGEEMAEGKAYVLGARNPNTIQDETYEQERARYWAQVKAWAKRPGGKY
jgi:hypothetical protein